MVLFNVVSVWKEISGFGYFVSGKRERIGLLVRPKSDFSVNYIITLSFDLPPSLIY
jgi:hypothetical protein